MLWWSACCQYVAINLLNYVFCSSIKFNEISDGEGDLYLGVSKPNVDQFEGLLQDVKIFTKTLQGR